MQLRKIRWSDFRNSHACCMQISGAAGHYTHKLLHRRASPHTICSLSCSCSWGGLITDLEPLFFVQHASLDTLVSNLSNCFLGCFLLFLTENWRCRHFVATCGSCSETKLWRRGPTRPFPFAPRAHCRVVTLASDNLIRGDHFPRTCTLPHKDTHNNNKQIVPTSR